MLPRRLTVFNQLERTKRVKHEGVAATADTLWDTPGTFKITRSFDQIGLGFIHLCSRQSPPSDFWG